MQRSISLVFSSSETGGCSNLRAAPSYYNVRSRRRLAPSRERRDAQVLRERIEARTERVGDRNAVPAAIEPFEMALLARQPDALDAGKAARASKVAHER